MSPEELARKMADAASGYAVNTEPGSHGEKWLTHAAARLMPFATALLAAERGLKFLVMADPTWECQHGVPWFEFCSKRCPANAVREAVEAVREALR